MAKKDKSDITKKYKHRAIFTEVLSWLMLLTPLCVFTFIGFYIGEPTQKFTLGITITVAAILVVINFVNKLHLRSTLWVILLGIGFCIDNIKPLLMIMAITTLIDELVLQPLHNNYKSKYTINNEIDRRL